MTAKNHGKPGNHGGNPGDLPPPPINETQAFQACGRKKVFSSRKKAKEYGKHMIHIGVARVQKPYACPYCGLWHLTGKHREET